jgi:hypothetical protein
VETLRACTATRSCSSPRDAGRIADEVIAHLAGQTGADVTVTIEIEARLPNGTSDQLVCTVTENSRTLRFDTQGFKAPRIRSLIDAKTISEAKPGPCV